MEELRIEIIIPKDTDTVMVRGLATPWLDLGVLLEATGMLCAQVLVAGNPKGLKTIEEIIQYAKDYLDKSGHDYQKNWSAKVPKID